VAIERRKLGSTGEELSVVGFGGIIVMNESLDDARRYVCESIDRGVNYFDVAPTYGDAETGLGPALEGRRDEVFLACKTAERTREAAAEELRGSLERLRTDHVDLYQFHAVTTLEEVDRITKKGGALEAFTEAKEKGLARFLGMSAHSDEAAVELMRRAELDNLMIPVNYVTWHQGNFAKKALREATRRGMGVTALKSLARTSWPDRKKRTWPKCWYMPVLDRDEAEMALRFTLSRPVASAVSPSHWELFEWMLDIAEKGVAPLSDEEEKQAAASSEGIRPIFPED